MAFSFSLDKNLFLDTDDTGITVFSIKKTEKIRIFREISVQLLFNSGFEKAI